MMGAAVIAWLVIAQPMEPFVPARCSGCSCRGGPGYRAEDGKCVGWKELKRKCGDPPTTRCSDERNGGRSDRNKKDDEE
jgi:hypothetical protein